MFLRKILSFFGFLLIKISMLTNKLQIENKEIPDYFTKKRQVLFAFWHGRQFILFDTHKNKNIAILASASKDGDFPANILKLFKYKVFRGSSNRGGSKALIEMVRALKKGCNIAIAVDGPRGPIYEAKPGLLFLAQKHNLPIILVATAAKKFWEFKSWDKFIVPKFFTNIALRYGGPFIISENDDLKEKTKLLSEELRILQENLDKDIKR